MEGIDIGKVTTEENSNLENPISKEEIAQFIKGMSNDKAPGITGITPAFHKVLLVQIGDMLTEAINNCLETPSFPQNKK